MNKSELFFGGLPTGPDVNKLNEEWPNPKEKDRFPYTRISEIIGVPIDSNRFRNVTIAWRQSLQEKGVVTACIRSQAIVVQTCDEVISCAYDDVKGIQRKLKRRRKKLAVITPMDQQTMAARNHAAHIIFALEEDTKKKSKEIQAPKVIQIAHRTS